MDYRFISLSGRAYIGSGQTPRAAILDALGKFAAEEIISLAHGKSWCIQFVRLEVSRRKAT